MALIEVSEAQGVVTARVPAPVPPGEPMRRLAAELAEVCADVNERTVPPAALVLRSTATAFCLPPPTSTADLDAVTAGWARATAAVAGVEAPTVALLEGDAVGPAWELALACDLRLAAATVRVGSPETQWGRMPAAGGTQRLARLAGPAAALRLLLLGEVLSAADAQALRLVHRVVPPDAVEADLADLLAPLRGAAPIALTYAKEAIHRSLDLPLADGLRLEADLAALLQTTSDRAEGVRAFLARRAPAFEGQ